MHQLLLIQLAPGSFLELMTAENQVSDPATVELLRKTYGLDDPVWLQLLKYIWALLRFDFGFSYRQNMPVIQAIGVHLPATIAADGVEHHRSPGGRRRRGRRRLDEGAHLLGQSGLGRAPCSSSPRPSFWLGIMLIVLFAVKLGWLPVGGMATIGGARWRSRRRSTSCTT